MIDFSQWRNAPIFQNTLTAWAIAGTVAAVVFVILFAIRVAIRRYAKRLKATERTEFLEIPMLALCRTTLLFMLIVATCIGSQSLQVSAPMRHAIASALMI